MSWHNSISVVAGADLSAHQYKFVNYSGVLATSETNPCGVLQNKPEANEHATLLNVGRTRLIMVDSVGVGAFVGQSNTTSGFGAIVTSGGFAFGRTATGCDSGGLAMVDLFGAPVYIAL